jgi:acyl-CoA synthetase (AMP-forming)/AMP-acid ligase II
MFARVMNFGNSSEHVNRLAVADQNNSLTFQQLSTAVRGVAKMIQGHVTGKHQVVAVLMDRSALYTTSMLGIMRAGCVYLPLNSADPIDRIKGILEDAQATLVITQPNKLDILKDITSVRPLVVSLEEVMKPVEVSLPVIGMKDPCYMIFTSGTTGKPKGVVVPHMALSNLANEMSASFSDVQGPKLGTFRVQFRCTSPRCRDEYLSWQSVGDLETIRKQRSTIHHRHSESVQSDNNLDGSVDAFDDLGLFRYQRVGKVEVQFSSIGRMWW